MSKFFTAVIRNEATAAPGAPPALRVIVPALAVPCSLCGADKGSKCIPHHRPLHHERSRDAQAVQEAMEALLS